MALFVLKYMDIIFLLKLQQPGVIDQANDVPADIGLKELPLSF